MEQGVEHRGPSVYSERADPGDPTTFELEHLRKPVVMVVIVQHSHSGILRCRSDEEVGEFDAALVAGLDVRQPTQRR
jgi:hypothetical protein